MKNLKQDIKSGFIIFLTIISLSAITVFAANWYDSLTATSGEALTATKWNTLAKTTVPTGAIMAFNSDTGCPDGWVLANGTNPTNKVGGGSNILDLRGKFLRGLDSSGTFDSVRTLGNYQTDDFKNHNHAGAIVSAANGVSGSYGTYAANGNTSSAGGTETRPKNVAVLYCVKQ